MAFPDSKYQTNIYDFIRDDDRNLIVNSTAGSGKTTTLEGIVRVIPDEMSVLLLAFNKTICEEIIKRVKQKPNTTIQTTYAFGRSCFWRMNAQLDERKYQKLLLKNDFGDLIPRDVRLDKDNANIIELCRLARLNLCESIFEVQQVNEKYGVDAEDWEAEVALQLMSYGKSIFTIDFTDMIWIPIVVPQITIPKFDFVLVDEAQDLSSAQCELMLNAVNPNGGRFVAVADKFQAIYGFAGSDAESYDKLAILPNTHQLPLSVSYRCAKSIIELAQEIVPEIEARENAPEGVVNFEAKLSDIKSGDMVLCRNTQPLVSLYLKLITEGRKATIKGIEIGNGLAILILNTKERRISYAVQRLYLNWEKRIEKLMKKKNISREDALDDEAINNYKEKIEIIKVLSVGYSECEDVIAKIRSVFTEQRNGVMLSTIHKAKGLEANRVFIIHPELMPAKQAKQDWQKVQEENLRYVAYTRAKNYLGFIDKKDFNGFNEKIKEIKRYELNL